MDQNFVYLVMNVVEHITTKETALAMNA